MTDQIEYEAGFFLAQCINFPLQRNITFKSKGNPVYQAIWYFIAWVVISLICNGCNNLWMPLFCSLSGPTKDEQKSKADKLMKRILRAERYVSCSVPESGNF